MESEQLKISQKFDHSSAPNIRIRSAQPRMVNFNRGNVQSALPQASKEAMRKGLTTSNPLISQNNFASRGRINDYERFSRVSNIDKIAAIITKQDQFKREHQSKENLPTNFVKNFFDMYRK